MDKAMIARNARKHYSMGGVPCWNPSLACFFCLEGFRAGGWYPATASFSASWFGFFGAIASDWHRVDKAGKRKRKPLQVYRSPVTSCEVRA